MLHDIGVVLEAVLRRRRRRVGLHETVSTAEVGELGDHARASTEGDENVNAGRQGAGAIMDMPRATTAFHNRQRLISGFSVFFAKPTDGRSPVRSARLGASREGGLWR